MLITSLLCISSASCSFEEACVEFKIKISEKVKSEMSRLRTQASLVPLAVLQTDNNLLSECWISPPPAPPPHK